MKVLIVDDNELMRSTIGAILTEMGHEVVGEAEEAAGALESFAALKPEMVFLDLVMPCKSGIEVLQEIRAADPKARVVIITAVEQTETDKDLLKKGATAIIRKPFSFEEFKESVNRILI